ncbi:MAG TPA: universal stress protein [Acidimicrobiales bacterium]|nr:universal stress protein [Acidimicrobiales bacterium]
MYGRVLVGTDGSPTAGRAVDRAVEVAVATGSALTILAVGGDDALETARTEAGRHRDSGVDIEARAAEGDVADVLVEEAVRVQAGLMVVGSKGMTGIRRISSVPNKVSHHAPCHLLIVHTT